MLVLTVSSVNIMGWPLGAPEQACNTITPNHISTANTATGEAPFSVNINDIGSSYNPGEMYTSKYAYVYMLATFI